MFTRLVQCNCK